MAKSTLMTSDFWVATAERAIKTVAQTLVGSGLLDWVAKADIEADTIIKLTISTGILSILSSIGSASIGGNGPSATKSEVLATPVVPDPPAPPAPEV